jgi:hypothetical protein
MARPPKPQTFLTVVYNTDKLDALFQSILRQPQGICPKNIYKSPDKRKCENVL